MAQSANSKGTDKVILKLQKSVEEGNYYEAHQMYRTVCNRYVKQSKFDKAIELLTSGASTLLKHGQSGSGTDLILYLLEVYKLNQVQVSDETKARLIELLQQVPSSEPGRKSLYSAAINWSAKFGDNPNGSPGLYHAIGAILAKEGSLQQAESYLLHGTEESAKLLAEILVQWNEQEEFKSSGSSVVREYLYLQNFRDAKIYLEEFTRKLLEKRPDLKGETVPFLPRPDSQPIDVLTYKLPLINFAQFLLLAAQRESTEVFFALRNQYGGELSRVDKGYDQLGEMYFGIQQRRPNNILQDLMSSLFAAPTNTPTIGHSSGPQADLD
ncbi:DUF410-domain-containing protein [Basidiobolus meristosporus CBS 931.73]|uniref:DUF410-domain-containing protein n=1 Tax=Basidiobolus meristosporus CBS 931.73 TaxID=1314790 RepID=A0A1Y1VRD1_9FUNG|nr:DUF410-domain-containing protein [Basidiobolus meristosporus CBS 931.73]|eukprot:ORX63830.1 DUF410-domain-containing protein [Basidiobolus meristosporus CBS 931.73]